MSFAVTTILVLHVGVIEHHVPCDYDFMFARYSYHRACAQRAYGGPCPLALGGRSREAFATPRQQRGLGGARPSKGLRSTLGSLVLAKHRILTRLNTVTLGLESRAQLSIGQDDKIFVGPLSRI